MVRGERKKEKENSNSWRFRKSKENNNSLMFGEKIMQLSVKFAKKDEEIVDGRKNGENFGRNN